MNLQIEKLTTKFDYKMSVLTRVGKMTGCPSVATVNFLPMNLTVDRMPGYGVLVMNYHIL